MLFYHLPDTYIDAVRSHEARKWAGQQNPFTTSITRGLFPASIFEANHEPENQTKESNQHSRQALSEISKASLRREESFETQDTAESSIEDWDDTYSLDSDDDESLIGERKYDDWLSRTTLSESEYDEENEGDNYFAPSPEDFPRAFDLPVVSKQSLQAVPPKNAEAKSHSQESDFWTAMRQHMSNIRSVADRAIEQLCRKGDEVRLKFAQRESPPNTSCRSLPTQANAITVVHNAKRAPLSRTRSASKSDRAKNVTAVTHKTILMQKPRLMKNNANAFPSSRLVPIKAFANLPRGPQVGSIKRRNTQDNLAQFFRKPVQSASRSMVRAKNTLVVSQEHYSDKSTYASKESFNPFLNTHISSRKTKRPPRGNASISQSKGTSVNSQERKTNPTFERRNRFAKSRSKNADHDESHPSPTVRTKPKHRRTRSLRLIPAAMKQNDFPWY